MICGALTPNKGGGIASVINNIVKHTCSHVDYTLASFFDFQETDEIQELYPPSVRIELMRGNVKNNLQMLLSKEKNFDIIHVHGLNRYSALPVLASMLSGFRTAVIYSHHVGLEQIINGPFKLSYAYTLFNIVSRGWKKVIVNSHYCAIRELGRFRHLNQKMVMIPNGVDIYSINKATPLSVEGNPAIVFLGHVTNIKGIDILLKAFNSVSRELMGNEAHLHIVGSGDMDTYCRAYVKRMGLENRVHFWGAVTHSSALRILKGCDIFILPSRYENFPVVVLEAMAAGKPIIATSVGGIPEFFKNEANGILVEPLESEMASALRHLIEDEKFRIAAGAYNARNARTFSWEKIAKKYLCLYGGMCQ